MKDNTFDIKVEINVRVMPRACPYDMGEKIIWNGIENRVNWNAKKLGISLEKYFENLVEEEVNLYPKFNL